MVFGKTSPPVPQTIAGYKSGRPHRYDDVVAELLKHHPSADVDFLAKAYAFGAKAHHGQIRKSGQPYYSHPISVAFILASIHLDLETVAAGFLHDVVEDCDVTNDQMEKLFGPDLARIVDGVTKIGKVKFNSKVEAQAENYRKMILAMADDIRVLIVKLADRLHNMRTLHFLPEHKQQRISRETLEIFSPLAHRIGMSQIKNDLEMLAFYYLEPDAYRQLDQQLSGRERQNRKLMVALSKELSERLAKHEIQAVVTNRVKSHFSIHRKLQTQGATLEGIYDYYAFRILTESIKDCYTVLGVLHENWQPIPGRFKDFIATPKLNLYQSLHTTLIGHNGIPFEVQIRTRMMHQVAEEGVAAHWSYKHGRLMSVGQSNYSNWLKKLASEQGEIKDTAEFMETIKDQLKTDEILVFTPAGEIKSLPRGSTPLDFAYLIHTEVGHSTIGAKVDGKMASLRTELRSGHIVEIMTGPRQRPKQEWLKIVKSSSARNKIRSWLRSEERKKSLELGRQIFERELRKYKVPLKSVTKDLIQSKIKDLGVSRLDDFYSAIGFGKITPVKAVEPFLPEGAAENKDEAATESRLMTAFNRLRGRSQQMVLVKGQHDVLVFLAKCCNPIIGDSITGYITRGRGVAVHKTDCPTLVKMGINPERKISVEWDRSIEKQVFNVRVKIFTDDRPGMIADISHAISDTKTNVLRFKADADSEKRVGIFDVVLEVHSLDHLQKVFRSLKKVKGYLNHERMG